MQLLKLMERGVQCSRSNKKNDIKQMSANCCDSSFDQNRTQTILIECQDPKERKKLIIRSIETVLQQLHYERRVCEIELKKCHPEPTQSMTTDCCFTQTIVRYRMYGESLPHEKPVYLKILMDLIIQSITEFIELKYSVENNFKNDKEISIMEESFCQFWKRISMEQ